VTDALRSRLRDVLDGSAGRYRELNGARSVGEYLSRERPREDEEVLTEPLFADLLEDLLGFPHDAYFPQLGRSGLKPDFTPHDLVAHRFVLDAKSSTQELAAQSSRSGHTSTSGTSTTASCSTCARSGSTGAASGGTSPSSPCRSFRCGRRLTDRR